MSSHLSRFIGFQYSRLSLEINPSKMKFSTAIFIATATCGRAFAPQRLPSQAFSTLIADSDTALFGRRRGKKSGPKTRRNKSTAFAEDISEGEVRDLFSIWNNALATGDSRIVAKRYAKESILLPTVSDVPRTDYDSIKDYFDAFLLKKPQGKILEGDIRIGKGWAQDAGVYEFTMGGKFILKFLYYIFGSD